MEHITLDAQSALPPALATTSALPLVRKRTGEIVAFDSARIAKAVEKAFLAEYERTEKDSQIESQVLHVTEKALSKIEQRVGVTEIDIETIQDVVEEALMESGHFRVARCYIVYRAERAKARALKMAGRPGLSSLSLKLLDRSHSMSQYDGSFFFHILADACRGRADCQPEVLARELASQMYPGISEDEVYRSMVMVARSQIEREPDYALVASRLLLAAIYRETFPFSAFAEQSSDPFCTELHRQHFESFLDRGIAAGRLSPALKEFDLLQLAAALRPERDDLFRYMGLQTLYDRYLIHIDRKRLETPQYFWMRVAMGLACREGEEKTKRAIEFYEMISTFRFTPSTPTLFNSGTLHPQLSSCFLTTVSDDLTHIFKSISDNARLSKWAGGLGNDWTNVRAVGSHIKGTNGESQGIVPFLKVANDTAVAVNQGGKRQGAVCAYLETWHLDIEEFLDLRKNTGDERRRTHDMNTANWIPDLFMKRVRENGVWTLFSPGETADLHDLYGREFEKRYEEYERLALAGKIRQYRQLPAGELWRKMLSRLFETGHPWITFKDPSNIRSPQDHCGVVHSSNLCTEILLNTSSDETAVCNLGSVNLVEHIAIRNQELDLPRLQETVRTAIRMLDNVIDINFYPTPEAANSNGRHRPIGLGIMGFQDCLSQKGIGYDSEEAIEFADTSMEAVSYFAILASADLAKERGTYESYPGSKWDRGLLPIDTLQLIEEERQMSLPLDRSVKMNWDDVHVAVATNGMRNSNVLAIAPTATIANIVGVASSIEPTYRNLYVKSNLSGDFTVVNTYLVEDLKRLLLWDAEMLADLKYHDGSLEMIARVPDEIRERYRTAFEIDQRVLIECASRRQKWIDMGQSLNLYVGTTSGKALSELYMYAWEKGLKTTYYLRTLGATQIEKSTLDVNAHGIQPKWMKNRSASSDIVIDRSAPKACSITDPECEACQ